MQTKRERSQQSLMLLPPLESFVPQDHYLRKLNRVLDLSFVHEAVRGRYCQDNGRPSIDPEVIIRLFLIQALEGIPRVRELMRQVQVNLAYRWFIGYELDEKLPDHSTLSKALSRFGDEVFDELFRRSIGRCRESGLIEGKVLHVDATTIQADLNANRVGQPDSPDGDARFGHFADKKIKPSYKQHTVADGQRRVVVGLSVTPGDRQEHDEAIALIDAALTRLGSSPQAVCADGAYGSGLNAWEMERRPRCPGGWKPLCNRHLRWRFFGVLTQRRHRLQRNPGRTGDRGSLRERTLFSAVDRTGNHYLHISDYALCRLYTRAGQH
jgi:transposase